MPLKSLRAALLAALAGAALAPSLSHAQALDLSRYSLSATYHAMVGEASGITYNWDNDSLFIVGDSLQFSELTKTGEIYSYPLPGSNGSGIEAFKDSEGIAYIGNGEYLLADERAMTVSLMVPEATWDMGGGKTRTAYSSKPGAPTYTFGPESPNQGIEGVTWERSTGTVFAIKERREQGVFQADIDFANGASGSHVSLFDPALLGVQSLSDISVLSNSTAFAGRSFADNLLILSATSQVLLEVTRTGEIVSRLDLTGMATKIEGVTVDNDGVIYLVGESGGPSGASALLVLTAPVPEPESYAMMLAGLAAVGAFARRRRAASRKA
jgi:uncharacterized protein YjiK